MFDARHEVARSGAVASNLLYTLVKSSTAGRVISYQVTFNAPLSDEQRVDLIGEEGLPKDAIGVSEVPQCKLWRSVALEHLIGMAYARSTTVPGTTSAQIAATPIPSC